MAAYAALASLNLIVDQLQHHPSPPISLNKKQVRSITENVTFLQEFLEGYTSPVADSQEADPLEMRIADAAYAAEDVIESHIVDRILANSKYHSKKMRFPDLFRGLIKKPKKGLQKVIDGIDLIKKEVMEIIDTEKAVVQIELQRNVSTSVGSLRYSTMVGLDGVLLEIMDKLVGGRRDCQIISIVGMGGIGKTTLARNIYAHRLIKEHFDICAWTTISQQYNTKEILCEVLSQANKKGKEQLSKMSEDELGSALHKYLFGRRFLIVMDDMWSIEAWDKIQHFFPENNDSSRIVVTTRLWRLGSQLDNTCSIKMRFLDEVSSWNLFSKIAFRENSCPHELEEIGKKIVEGCRGLPLSIVVMGGLLEKLQHTQKCWKYISDNLNAIVNSENGEYCLKILKMSYNHLPSYLKPCFLYMGVFEEDRVIRVSTLVKLWVSEGFLKPISGKTLETIAREYLSDLVDRNLVLVHELGSTGNIKYCKIHDILRDLCLREAQKESFYNVIGKHNSQGLNSQRCAVIPGTTSNEEALDALQSMPLARSFICDNSEVQPLLKLRLLRTLKAYDRDTFGSHDYLFDDLFQFVNSRYLAAGVDWKCEFPSSVNLLWNLQTLIICHSGFVFVPPNIWKMPQLRHVEFHKGELNLPYRWSDDNNDIIIMENLQTLKGVCNFRYGVEASKMIPNIKKLGVTDGRIPNLECLSKLECFRCWNIFTEVDGMEVSTFPLSLKKLCLGSNTSHWEMHGDTLVKIGALPLLQKLKLERVHFRRCKWETIEGQFPSLKFLELKWCRLESWTTESYHFPCLEQLHLCGLRELEEIPSEIGEIPTLQSILLEYCSESVVESAKKIADEQEELRVRVVLFNNHHHYQALRSLASPNFLVEITDF